MKGLRRTGTVAAVVALVASFVVLTVPAGASPPNSIDRTSSQIDSLQVRADRLAQQITSDQNEVTVEAEQYDEQTVLLQKDRLKLATTLRQLRTTRRQIAAARVRVRTAAVQAYVTGDGFASQVGAVLNSTVNNADSAGVYSDVVTHTLEAAIGALHAVNDRQAAERATQLKTLANVAQTQRAANEARAAAQAATSNTETLLHEVKGQLYTLTVKREQEIAAAAAAAAARAARAAAARAAAARAAAARAAAARAAAAAAAKRQQANEGNNGNGFHYGPGTGSNQPGYGEPLNPAGSTPQGLEAVAAAESFLGVPYVWGGASRKGVDCSGLTMLAWQAAGVDLLHGATAQDQESTRVALNQLEPGDLLFYHFANDGPWPITHVAMYVGSGPYGTQTIIQAAEVGTNVSYTSMYWEGFVSAGQP